MLTFPNVISLMLVLKQHAQLSQFHQTNSLWALENLGKDRFAFRELAQHGSRLSGETAVTSSALFLFCFPLFMEVVYLSLIHISEPTRPP